MASRELRNINLRLVGVNVRSSCVTVHYLTAKNLSVQTAQFSAEGVETVESESSEPGKITDFSLILCISCD